MFKKLIDNKEKELEKTYDLLNLRKKELETLSKEVKITYHLFFS